MDFNRSVMKKQGHGIYEYLDPSLLPKVYIAYLENGSEGSEIFHNNINERFQCKDTKVMDAMKFWANLAVKTKQSLLKGEKEKIKGYINQNFDMRKKIYRISDRNLLMVKTARSVGASAKFSGSGGAIVGTYEDDEMLNKLHEAFAPLDIKVVSPKISKTERS